MKEYHRDILAFVRGIGATNIVIGPGVHPKMTWLHQGKTYLYTLCSSPSDHRASLNAISTLRRMMGMTKSVKIVGKRRQRKQRAAKQPVPIPVVSTLPEEPWRKKLREMRR